MSNLELLRTDRPRRRAIGLGAVTAAALVAGLLAVPASPVLAAVPEPCWDGVFTDVDGGGPGCRGRHAVL